MDKIIASLVILGILAFYYWLYKSSKDGDKPRPIIEVSAEVEVGKRKQCSCGDNEFNG